VQADADGVSFEEEILTGHDYGAKTLDLHQMTEEFGFPLAN
jgi:hypothetical protein